jgi:CHAT domain-containing protein
VVLSACQSGLGEEDPGPEPTSLASAFSVAGAGTVISSLWPVEDQATSYMFSQFYSELAKGKGRLQSLETARAACRLKYPHPYYWAAFTLQGNPF